MITTEWLRPGDGQALEAVRAMRREAMEWDIERTTALGVNAADMIRGWYESERLEAYFEAGCGLLVARCDGAIAGTATLNRLDASRCEVRRVFVRPGARRAGTGRILMEALLDRARSEGYSRAMLETATFMAEAHRLYGRLGFTPCGDYGEPPPEAVRHLTLHFSREL